MINLLNCPNCGAPLEKDYCSYCGSLFLDWACFDLNAPTFVKIKDEKGIFHLVKLQITEFHEIDDDILETILFCDDEKYINIKSKTNFNYEAKFTALPFKHYLIQDREILQILIDPTVANQEDISKLWQKGELK